MVVVRSFCVFLCLIVSLSFTVSEIDPPQLKGVFLIFRHGSRAPRVSYPNDPYKDYKWPAGYGFLTEVGIGETYASGVKFRRRYDTLFRKDQIFNSSFVQVRSSANPRCLMSAQSFMAGFMPPPPNWVLPINWQPVLIESVPAFQDSTIAQLRNCSKYSEMSSEMYSVNNPEIMDFMGDKYYLFDYISEQLGMPVKGIDNISEIADTLYLQQKEGLTMPEWAAELFNDTFIPLSFLANHYTYSSKLWKARAGSLLKDIVSYLESFKENTAATQTFLILSGHDVTINSLAYLLDIQSQLPVFVDFVSTFGIEIYENQALENDFEIKFLFFRDHADEHPILLKIPGCAPICSISQFIKATLSKVVEDYDAICNNYRDNIISK